MTRGSGSAVSSSGPSPDLSDKREDDDNDDFLDPEDPDVDAIQECSKFCPPSRGSGDEARVSALDDPTLAPPADSKADWPAEIVSLQEMANSTISDEEKTRLLHEALVLRIEDMRVHDDHKVAMLRRLDEAGKERDRLRTEAGRALTAKVKLEQSCRELQTQKVNYAAENKKIAEDEQNRHTELKEKFEQAIKDVQEKMDAEFEVQQHFVKENDELRGKLLNFTETYEAQEKQLAEQHESRQSEMEVAQGRLKEHETMCGESKKKTSELDKGNEAMRKSTTVLRNELQTILGKFDEFHEAVTGSNTRHGECKAEVDTLQVRLQDLEKENAELKENKVLSDLTSEQQALQKQRDALDKLCDNLQKENRKHQEQLKKLQRAAKS